MTAANVQVIALVCYALATGMALMSLKLGRSGRSLWQSGSVALGVLAHTASIGVYCAQTSVHFFTSWSEILNLFSWALAIGYLAILIGWSLRTLGALILPLVILMLLISNFIETPGYEPVAGASSHPYFAIHIMSAFLGYGLFLTGSAVSLVYLQQQRLLKRKVFDTMFRSLPSLNRLERAEIVCAWVGLLSFTLALITGVIMAHATKLHNWYFHPQILGATLTWSIFLLLVIGRATRKLAGRTAAKIVLVGALCVLATFMIRHPTQTEADRQLEQPENVEHSLRKRPYFGVGMFCVFNGERIST